MIRGCIGKGQKQIGKDIRVGLQIPPRVPLNIKDAERKLGLGVNIKKPLDINY